MKEQKEPRKPRAPKESGNPRARKSKKPAPPEIVKITPEELRAIVESTRKGALTAEQTSILQQVVESYLWILMVVQSMKVRLSDLHRQLFGKKSEKTEDILNGDPGQPNSGENSDASDGDAGAEKKKRKGHGRNGADAYTSARKHECKHETLKPGDECPACKKGKVYELQPAVLVIVTGQAPLVADRYDCQRLRCNFCGEVFTASPPEEARRSKYNETCATIIGLLKYGSGLPFNRVERLERDMGIPLPASTQWEIVFRAVVLVLGIVYTELIRQAARCDIVYNDDTNARILARASRRSAVGTGSESDSAPKGRTGTFTSGVVADGSMGKIALFFTGWRHAGENLARVLRERPDELSPPIQMCDGLDRNVPGELATILGNCLTHGRRHFVKLLDNFPKESRFVIKALRRVYRNDDEAREAGLRPP